MLDRRVLHLQQSGDLGDPIDPATNLAARLAESSGAATKRYDDERERYEALADTLLKAQHLRDLADQVEKDHLKADVLEQELAELQAGGAALKAEVDAIPDNRERLARVQALRRAVEEARRG